MESSLYRVHWRVQEYLTKVFFPYRKVIQTSCINNDFAHDGLLFFFFLPIYNYFWVFLHVLSFYSQDSIHMRSRLIEVTELTLNCTCEKSDDVWSHLFNLLFIVHINHKVSRFMSKACLDMNTQMHMLLILNTASTQNHAWIIIYFSIFLIHSVQ